MTDTRLLTLTLKRLTPDDPLSWALWPLFEQRIRAACPTLCPMTPPEKLIAKIRTLWATAPLILGAWVALQGKDEGNGGGSAIVAHAIGWVDFFWEQPYLLIYQIQSDPGVTVTALRDGMLSELSEWADVLNSLYEKSGRHERIQKVFWMAVRDAAWERYWRPLVRSTLVNMEIDLTLWKVIQGKVCPS